MRYIFLLIVIYFAFKAAGNLLEAVQNNGDSQRKIDRGRYADEEIEEAKWEDIE